MLETSTFAGASSRRALFAATILVLALPRALLAQTAIIAGKVTDGTTKQPLADVRVTIAGTALATQSNAQGGYRLANVRPGPTTVAAFRVGYKATRDTVRLVAGQTVTLDIEMTPSLVTLSEVVVTGTAGNEGRRALAALGGSM